MSTDEYVPSEKEVREEYVYGAQEVDMDGRVVVSFDEACSRWDRFLARVRRDAKAEALREAAENVDVGSLVGSWTRGAVTRLSVTNAVAEVLMPLRTRATEYETGDGDEHR